MIKQLERASYQLLDDALRRHGLTPSQYMVLSLSHGGGTGRSSAELARRARMSAQAMNELIAALEAKGLIQRAEDPDHRRILRVRLTRPGVSLLRLCEAEVDAIEAEFFAALSPGENALLRELLGKILQPAAADEALAD